VSAVAIKRVSVALDGNRVVDDVSLAVEVGRWLALVGPNGAGKTTLLRAIAALVGYDGAIAVLGRDCGQLRRREVARLIAFVPQDPLAPRDMTVGDYVLLGRTPHIGTFAVETTDDVDAAKRAVRRLDLDAFMQRPLGTLSGGERQRAVLARALAQEAPLLLLDEPTSSLDIGRQQQVLELVDGLRREDGLTVLSAMHDLTLAAQYADELALIDSGRIIAQGSPSDVLEAGLLARHYGATVRVLVDEFGPLVVPMRASGGHE
jgi:iron complex transport system ATP-binding protein